MTLSNANSNKYTINNNGIEPKARLIEHGRSCFSRDNGSRRQLLSNHYIIMFHWFDIIHVYVN